jgi:hypothetical protein
MNLDSLNLDPCAIDFEPVWGLAVDIAITL